MKKTKYEEVYSYIVNYISSNGLRFGDRLMTEKVLTEQFDCSRITVQKAIAMLDKEGVIYRVQGSGSYVGETIKPKIISDNPQSNTQIHLILTYDGRSDRAIEVMQGAESYLEENSLYLSISTTYGDSEREKEIIEKLIKNNIKNILVMPVSSETNFEFFSAKIKEGVKFVFIDHFINNLSVSYVASDNISGGYMATKHLINKGHKDIMFVSPNPIQLYSSFRTRFQGYKNALIDSGIPYNKDLVIECTSNSDFKSIIEGFKDLKVLPSAVFVINDYGAIEFCNNLLEAGYKIPDDFEVIGYDNLDLLKKQSVNIATIDQDFFNMGKTAAKVLLEAMQNDDGVISIKKLPVKLVEY